MPQLRPADSESRALVAPGTSVLVPMSKWEGEEDGQIIATLEAGLRAHMEANDAPPVGMITGVAAVVRYMTPEGSPKVWLIVDAPNEINSTIIGDVFRLAQQLSDRAEEMEHGD